MRNVIVSEFISIDGVVEDPGGSEGTEHGGWTFPYWNDDIGKLKLDEVVASDALLLGRVTYAGFAAAWPSRTDESGFADKMNSMAKYVVSTTLTEPSWNNSTLIKDDVPGTVTALKREAGDDILVAGSVALVQTLLEYDLVDELRLLVYPVVLGSGKRLFGGSTKIDLQLAETRAFDSGVVLLSYRR